MQSESRQWRLRVAEGDRLKERSEGRKLPQQKTRALATLRNLQNLEGCSGGDARGAEEGAQPHNRPPLPHAAQASQTLVSVNLPARRAETQKDAGFQNGRAPRRRPKRWQASTSLPEGETQRDAGFQNGHAPRRRPPPTCKKTGPGNCRDPK